MSMNPGLTIFPAASMVVAPCSGEIVPMARMVSPTIPRSAVQVGPPVPSRMVPLRITRSNLDSASILNVGNREKPTAADAPVVMNCRRVRLAGMVVLLSRMIQVPGSPRRPACLPNETSMQVIRPAPMLWPTRLIRFGSTRYFSASSSFSTRRAPPRHLRGTGRKRIRPRFPMIHDSERRAR